MQNLKNKKVIFFDLDNTLLDHSHAESSALSETFNTELSALTSVSYKEFHAVYHEINTNLWNLYNQSKATRDEVRLGRFTQTLSKFGISDYPVELLWERYAKRYADNWIPIDGAEEVLLDLKSKNYKLGIITNGFTSIQTAKLSKMNWVPFFESILYSEEIGIQKPNPGIFSTALDQVSSSVHDVVYIGDSFETDIVGAKNSGWDSIFFNPASKPVPPEIISITHLDQLKQIF